MKLYGCVNWTDYENEQEHYDTYGDCGFKAEGPGRIVFGGDYCEYYRIGCIKRNAGLDVYQANIPATSDRLGVVLAKEHCFGLRQPHFPYNFGWKFESNTFYHIHFDVAYSCWGSGNWQSVSNACNLSGIAGNGKAGICTGFGGAGRLAEGYKPYQNIIPKPKPGHHVITVKTEIVTGGFYEHFWLGFGNSAPASDEDFIVIDNVKLYKAGVLATNLLVDSGFTNGLPQDDWQDLMHVSGSHGWTEYDPDAEQFGCVNWDTGQFEVIVPDDYAP